MSAEHDAQVLKLFDFLLRRPGGITIQDIMAELPGSKKVARKTVRRFRLIFGSDDTINLVCKPNGQGQLWLYTLEGTRVGAESWVRHQIASIRANIESTAAVLASVVRGEDGRTKDGKEARIMHRGLSRIVEDLHELEEV